MMLTLGTLQLIVRAALHTCRIDAPTQTSEEAIGRETAAGEWIKMQSFLIDVELSFKLNFRNRLEGDRGVNPPNLNVEKSMRGAGIGERLLASMGVPRRGPLCVTGVSGSDRWVSKANPDSSAGDSIRYVCVVQVAHVVEGHEAELFPTSGKIPDELPQAITAGRGEEVEVLARTELQGHLAEAKRGW